LAPILLSDEGVAPQPLAVVQTDTNQSAAWVQTRARWVNDPSSSSHAYVLFVVGDGSAYGTVPVFRQQFTLEDAIGFHGCSLEVSMRVTNGIPPGHSLLLPVDVVNSVQTLKARHH
jgi:hypothetical protein